MFSTPTESILQKSAVKAFYILLRYKYLAKIEERSFLNGQVKRIVIRFASRPFLFTELQHINVVASLEQFPGGLDASHHPESFKAALLIEPIVPPLLIGV